MSRSALTRLLAFLLLAGSIAGCGPLRSGRGGTAAGDASLPGGVAETPRIRLLREPSGRGRAVFEVSGLDPAALAALEKAPPGAERWSGIFAVYVEVPGRSGDDLPAVAGSYEFEGGVLCFQPRYPLEPGLSYRAIFRGGEGEGAVPIEERFAIPVRAVEPTTVVKQVYPTTDVLPENQLKFYIHFSAPMSRGRSYERVHLLDAEGHEVELPFLELGEELWDHRATRFTLFIDPGRIKRGVRPREEIGPALEEGKSYTLAIDRDWRDATGSPLKEPHRKRFRVGPPDHELPDPNSWKLDTPGAGTVSPLVVGFPEPLDHALLNRLLWVHGPGGRPLEGEMEVTALERRWSFTPASPWRGGTYRLVAQTTLEDLAGNSIGRPFEVDVFQSVRRRVEVDIATVSFEVR